MVARAAHAARVLFHIWHRRRHASVSSCNCNATRNATGEREGARDAEEGSCCDRIVIYCARGSVAKYRCKRYWCVGKLDLRSLTEAVNKRAAQSVWTYVYTCLRHDIKWWVNRGNRSIVDSETIANAPTIVILKFLFRADQQRFYFYAP